jgi:hypothetical protein
MHSRLVNQFGQHQRGQLTIRYDPATERVTVWGSLQSYWQGSNVSAFNWHEVQAAGLDIVTALQIPAEQLKVHLLETGITAPTDTAPSELLTRLARAHYGPQQVPFYATEPPRNCTQPLQCVAHSNEIRVKLYDKGSYAKLKGRPLPLGTGNGFRYELHYLKSRRIGAALGWKGSVTWANIMHAENFAVLAQKLLDSWNQIQMPATMEAQHLGIDDLALLVAGQNPAFWEACKRETPIATYKRRRARFRELQQAHINKETNTNNYSEQVQQLIADLLPKVQS